MSKERRRQHAEAGSKVAEGAVKQAAEGVTKGAAEAADAADASTNFQ